MSSCFCHLLHDDARTYHYIFPHRFLTLPILAHPQHSDVILVSELFAWVFTYHLPFIFLFGVSSIYFYLRPSHFIIVFTLFYSYVGVPSFHICILVLEFFILLPLPLKCLLFSKVLLVLYVSHH